MFISPQKCLHSTSQLVFDQKSGTLAWPTWWVMSANHPTMPQGFREHHTRVISWGHGRQSNFCLFPVSRTSFLLSLTFTLLLSLTSALLSYLLPEMCKARIRENGPVGHYLIVAEGQILKSGWTYSSSCTIIGKWAHLGEPLSTYSKVGMMLLSDTVLVTWHTHVHVPRFQMFGNCPS